jgi:LacI family gluconate utilization system Gnt-I transcriptional repressor
MADVAKYAGVSAQTVSRALRNPRDVSEESYARIEAAIKATNYVQNFAASHLASNKSKTVAAIIPLLSGSIFSETIQGLNEVLLAEGYQLFIGHTDYRLDREEALVRSFSGRRPDGFFIIGTQHNRATRALLKRAGVPVVESWDWVERPIDMLVGFSNSNAIAAIVSHLFARGYRRPVFSGVIKPGDHRAKERLAGFEKAVNELFPGQPTRSLVISDRPISMATGAALLTMARAQYPEVDALVFSSDLFAFGALLECQRAGIPVPTSLAITGFGDYEFARQLNPGLTTIAVPTYKMGEAAAHLLLSAIRGGRIQTRAIDVGFEIKIRSST